MDSKVNGHMSSTRPSPYQRISTISATPRSLATVPVIRAPHSHTTTYNGVTFRLPVPRQFCRLRNEQQPSATTAPSEPQSRQQPQQQRVTQPNVPRETDSRQLATANARRHKCQLVSSRRSLQQSCATRLQSTRDFRPPPAGTTHECGGASIEAAHGPLRNASTKGRMDCPAVFFVEWQLAVRPSQRALIERWWVLCGRGGGWRGAGQGRGGGGEGG